MYYTIDISSYSTDHGDVFVIRLFAPGEHVGLASLYYVPDEQDGLHWYCSPTFLVVQGSG